MSLHDAIKDLHAAAKRLDTANFNPQMNELQKFVDKLDAKNLSAKPPEDVRQKALEKFLRGSDNFTNRELRSLPFIIYESQINLDGVKKILRKLNFFKASHLRGLVNVYLTCYDRSAKTELLRQRLQFMPQEMAGNSRRLQKIFTAREFLFGDNRLTNTTKLFANRQSVNDSLEALGLSNFFKVSNFIHVALVNFYRTSNFAAQMKILTELDADYNAYQNIFHAVADALIPTVDRTRADKKTCIEIFYHRLGDPRFGLGYHNWKIISDKSREIFLRWLAENDLETFFNIVAATSNDAQWSYRESFWRRHLPRITNTWIFLTGNAQRYAAQSKVRHGTLTNGNGNQAVFVFQIGRYIFSEWSNVGKVRAHDSGWQGVLFGRRSISGDFIRKNSVKDWIHSSPQTNFWQREVSDWIERHC